MVSHSRSKQDRVGGLGRTLAAALIIAAAWVLSGVASAQTLNTLVTFNGTNGSFPADNGGLIADAAGNLFGTTLNGGSGAHGTVYVLKKDNTTTTGFASAPTILVNFNGANDAAPSAGLIADAQGNLYGTTTGETFAGSNGTVYEVTGSGFVTNNICGVVPGKPNCVGETNSCLAQTFGGYSHAAAMLGFSSVSALQSAIQNRCTSGS